MLNTWVLICIWVGMYDEAHCSLNIHVQDLVQHRPGSSLAMLDARAMSPSMGIIMNGAGVMDQCFAWHYLVHSRSGLVLS